MDGLEEFVLWLRSEWVPAEVALHNGDAGPRRALWTRGEAASVFGAWKNASGQDEVDELFSLLARSFTDCVSFDFELLTADVEADIAYTVGFEHTSVSVDGVPTSYTLRVTQVYCREDGGWKVVHRHGSPTPT